MESDKINTFGIVITHARILKGYSQRKLSELVGIDYTYLSKLENDNSECVPSDRVIQDLAHHLGVSYATLKRLSGRIEPSDMEVFKILMKTYPELPYVLRRMKEQPKFAYFVLDMLKGLDD